MAFVIFEDDYYEITLEITRDFIADDYDTFIDKEPSKETKIIKWELIIRFKKLINKQFELLEYHLEQAKEWISKVKNYDFYPNSYTFTIGKPTLENFVHLNCMNPNFHFISHNISTMYYPPSVSVIFYCNENKIASSDNGQFNNYIFRLTYNILAISHVLSNIDYYEKDKPNSSIIINTYYPRNRGKEITDTYKQNKKELKDILTDIAINHWKEVKNNIEAFNLFCKSENKDINYNKIARSINFIKEYVRDIYKYTII